MLRKLSSLGNVLLCWLLPLPHDILKQFVHCRLVHVAFSKALIEILEPGFEVPRSLYFLLHYLGHLLHARLLHVVPLHQ